MMYSTHAADCKVLVELQSPRYETEETNSSCVQAFQTRKSKKKQLSCACNASAMHMDLRNFFTMKSGSTACAFHHAALHSLHSPGLLAMAAVCYFLHSFPHVPSFSPHRFNLDRSSQSAWLLAQVAVLH
eukprot:6209032-Pleurochrysis_carterae.AAC.2